MGKQDSNVVSVSIRNSSDNKRIFDQIRRLDRKFVTQETKQESKQETKQDLEKEKLYFGYGFFSSLGGANESSESVSGLDLSKEIEFLEHFQREADTEKRLFRRLKSIFLGLDQGYTMNLELQGIGYTAQLGNDSDQTLHIHKPPVRIDSSIGKERKTWPILDQIGIGGQLEENSNYLFAVDKSLKTIPLKTEDLNRNRTRICLLPRSLNIKKENESEVRSSPKKLILRLGTSHNKIFDFTKYEILVKILTQTQQTGGGMQNIITLFGISREILKRVATQIYLLKKPDPYKGKGVRYEDEKV
jgi:ribosomal protein L6P/L9E